MSESGAVYADDTELLAAAKHLIKLHDRAANAVAPDQASEADIVRAATGATDLVTWLGAETQALPPSIQTPAPDSIAAAFGTSASAEAFLSDLGHLREAYRDAPTVIVKRDLWRDLLAAALGEVINEEADLDRLFVRHTYLSTIVALAVQAAFGIDLRAVAGHRPADLVNGAAFYNEVGVKGVIESDFFGWPAETEVGHDWIARLARRVAGFNWGSADYDVARVLYQAVIPAEDRRRLGEYYTPDWLAAAIVAEVVTDPLAQRVLDPACGSGTFLRAAIASYLSAAAAAGWNASRTLSGLRDGVTGIDIHPVAVHLARATWVLAAREVIAEADDAGSLTVPVYLGDSLQLLADPGSLLGAVNVTIEPNTFFPTAACVVFAGRAGAEPKPLSRAAKRWLGPEGGPNTTETITLATAGEHVSPYGESSRQGATIVPRLLFFVHVSKSETAFTKGVVKVSPKRSAQEKPPWKDLNPPELSGSIENAHQSHSSSPRNGRIRRCRPSNRGARQRAPSPRDRQGHDRDRRSKDAIGLARGIRDGPDHRSPCRKAAHRSLLTARSVAELAAWRGQPRVPVRYRSKTAQAIVRLSTGGTLPRADHPHSPPSKRSGPPLKTFRCR